MLLVCFLSQTNTICILLQLSRLSDVLVWHKIPSFYLVLWSCSLCSPAFLCACSFWTLERLTTKHSCGWQKACNTGFSANVSLTSSRHTADPESDDCDDQWPCRPLSPIQGCAALPTNPTKWQESSHPAQLCGLGCCRGHHCAQGGQLDPKANGKGRILENKTWMQ